MSHIGSFAAFAFVCFSLFASAPAKAQVLSSPTLQFCERAYNVYLSEELLKRFDIAGKYMPFSACFEKNAEKISLDFPFSKLRIDFFRSKADGLSRVEVNHIESAAKQDHVVLDKIVIRDNVKNIVNAENENLGIQVELFPRESRMVRIHAYDMSAQDIFSLFEKTGRYKFHVVGKSKLSKKMTFNFIAVPDRVIFILMSEELGLTGSEVMNVVKEGRIDYIYSEKLADEKQ